jgi:hypothetical protein
MKAIYFLWIILLLASCSVDNFDAPDVTVKGRIIDAETTELVESGGINGGSMVKFYQNNSTQPLIYNTFPDGTFTNKRVFAGNYTYIAEGAFKLATTDPQTIIIDKDVSIEIKVVPNVRLKIVVTKLGATSAKVNVTFQKLALDQNLVQVAVMWSDYPQPNNFTFPGGAILQQDVSALNLISGEREFTIENLKPNTHYYIRASSRTNNSGNYYNYSTQFELQMN